MSKSCLLEEDFITKSLKLDIIDIVGETLHITAVSSFLKTSTTLDILIISKLPILAANRIKQNSDLFNKFIGVTSAVALLED